MVAEDGTEWLGQWPARHGVGTKSPVPKGKTMEKRWIDGCMANFGELENSEDTFWESFFLLDFRPTTELVVRRAMVPQGILHLEAWIPQILALPGFRSHVTGVHEVLFECSCGIFHDIPSSWLPVDESKIIQSIAAMVAMDGPMVTPWVSRPQEKQ